MQIQVMTRRIATISIVGVLAMLAGCGSSSSSPTTIATPQPPLPAGINQIPYKYNEVAALGNIQLAVATVTGNTPQVDDKAERDVVVNVMIRNGALTDVQLRPESFRVYTSDLRSVLPTNNPFTESYVSDSRHTAQLVFRVGPELLAVALVFDATGYGDRVFSGQFLLDPDISFAQS